MEGVIMRAPAPIGEAQSRTQASLDPALLTIALLTIATDLELAIGWSIGHNGKLAHVKLDSWTMIFPIRPQDLYTSRIFMARRSLEWLGSAHRADRRIVVIKNHQSHRGVAPSDHTGQRKVIAQTCFRTADPSRGGYRRNVYGSPRL